MKKWWLSIALLLWDVGGYSQQISLNGRVSIHNSKYNTGSIQYVSNAEIRAPFSSPDLSDSKGWYGITFSGIEAGTEVNLKDFGISGSMVEGEENVPGRIMSMNMVIKADDGC